MVDSKTSADFIVSAFYHFCSIKSPSELRKHLLQQVKRFNMKGTILVANEGINGTIAGTRPDTDQFFMQLRADDRFDALQTKESYTAEAPFLRAKVKVKEEIVTLGQPDLDPENQAGTHVRPEDWNALISDPDVILVDTRNDYEVAIGSFVGAQNPHTQSFREFPDYAEHQLARHKDKKIAMFCTGGIRCEKSTALLKSQGFKEVYHLEGGILNYFEKVPASESRWQGACFVFDERVAVNQDLKPAGFVQCHACRRPLTPDDLMLVSYEPGLSCRYCIETVTDHQRARFAERQKQIQLAKHRGEAHLGDAARSAQAARKSAKYEARLQRTTETRTTKDKS